MGDNPSIDNRSDTGPSTVAVCGSSFGKRRRSWLRKLPSTSRWKPRKLVGRGLATYIPARRAAGDLEHSWRGQPGPPAERAWPDPAGAWYCTGIDWAQKRHYTFAVVVRCDTPPLQVVAVYRTQRRSWLTMTEHVGALLDEYPGPAAHDATGAGSAIGAFPALAPHDQLQGVTLVGRVRTDLFRNDIGAIERHEIVCPRIDVFYTEHLYCGEDDLFGSGHPPDTVVAMALAYHAFKESVTTQVREVADAIAAGGDED